ncbi:DUF4168 domain-containing protein [Alkalinema pantanalense CENA528]|uniref:DUF4168 domain-containing protein n=1 Tax=Alkalinema pantanalense TaxID=1620705 RepID=UPI003D6FF62E
MSHFAMINLLFSPKTMLPSHLPDAHLPVSDCPIQPTQFRRWLARSLWVGTVSSLTLLASWAPIVPLGTPSSVLVGTGLVGTQGARAEESSFTRYVRAAFEIEKQRRALIGKVKELTDGNVPNNVCHSSGLEQIPGGIREAVQGICNNFNRFAGETVKKYQLKPEEFNGFQRQAGNSDMRERINAEIKRLNLK